MAEFLVQLIGEFGLGSPHLVAPYVGTSAALFLAARHPGKVTSLVVGGGGSAYPLDVTGTLADIIAAPDIEAFRTIDIRATIGATVEPVAPRDQAMAAEAQRRLTAGGVRGAWSSTFPSRCDDYPKRLAGDRVCARRPVLQSRFPARGEQKDDTLLARRVKPCDSLFCGVSHGRSA